MADHAMLFYNMDGNLVQGGEFQPIPLYKGMKVVLGNTEKDYRVVDWEYHLTPGGESAEMRVTLEESPALSVRTEE
jgi:hypothetical protein